MACHVPRSSPAVWTFTSTSESAISGSAISAKCHRSAGPSLSCTIARIVTSSSVTPAVVSLHVVHTDQVAAAPVQLGHHAVDDDRDRDGGEHERTQQRCQRSEPVAECKIEDGEGREDG